MLQNLETLMSAPVDWSAGAGWLLAMTVILSLGFVVAMATEPSWGGTDA
jgi:hypothetical protein